LGTEAARNEEGEAFDERTARAAIERPERAMQALPDTK
jgi:hypothetical protein